MPPIIGITTYGRTERAILHSFYSEYYSIPADYVDAIRRAGGVPILLPPGEKNWQAWLEIVDGIIISGGSDLAPDHYNGDSSHPNLTGHDPERDETELALAAHLAERDEKPLLCICRGMQVLNVALGGTLYEHVGDIVDQDIHRTLDDDWAIQEVQVDPASFLAEIMDPDPPATFSGHHQALRDLGGNLKVVSTAADGIVEAVEKPDHPWLVAVQWHPEKSASQDPVQQRLFDELVRASQKQVERG